jgi:Domain of unknown function (DUF4406)
MKLYIAGPMTNYPEGNKPAFAAEAARLRGLGFEIVNPAELCNGFDGDWLACMRIDLAALVTCDGIALLPGWAASRGATIECHLARELGLRVMPACHILGLAGEFPVLAESAIARAA